MGCCTWRHFVIIICVLQIIVALERLIFDFMGFMWGSITANLVNLIVVVIGCIGSYQYRWKILLLYAVWSALWIAWNSLVICIYLNVGLFKNQNYGILDFKTGKKSWWFDHGFGCDNDKNFESTTTVKPTDGVTGCLLSFSYVEVIHAGIHILLAVIGFISGSRLACLYMEEDDSSVSVQEDLEYIKMNRPPRRSPPSSHLPYSSLQQSNTSSSGFTDLTNGTGDNRFKHHHQQQQVPKRPSSNKERPIHKPRPNSEGDALHRRYNNQQQPSNLPPYPAYENAESLRAHKHVNNRPPPYRLTGLQTSPGATVI